MKKTLTTGEIIMESFAYICSDGMGLILTMPVSLIILSILNVFLTVSDSHIDISSK